jgi:hypothetical protein
LLPRIIFDTNIFGDIQNGSIPKSDWRFLLCHRPGHGWPLSAVTVLELLAGVDGLSAERFPEARQQIELACQLSKSRVLEEPRYLLCKEVLHVPFPAKLERLRPPVLLDYMQVMRCARSLQEIHERRVQVRKLLTKGNGRAGFAGFKPSVVQDLVAGPKKEWLDRTEAFATEVYPRWREHLRATGKRLPDEMRAKVKSHLVSNAEKLKFGEIVLGWLEAGAKPESVAEITTRLDAMICFTIFVNREFLLGNYNLEKHDSDGYDQFQLHYLAVDRSVIVSNDSDLSKRTGHSSQGDRILSLKSL